MSLLGKKREHVCASNGINYIPYGNRIMAIQMKDGKPASGQRLFITCKTQKYAEMIAELLNRDEMSK